MVLGTSRLLLVAAVAATWTLTASEATAVNRAAAPVSANYYVVDADASVALYVSPRPTPPMVGHTYITYQPLAPHEFLYLHHRTYVTHHPDAPRTVTRVCWGHDPLQCFIPHYVDGHFFHNILDPWN
jgi:hypothetical protein